MIACRSDPGGRGRGRAEAGMTPLLLGDALEGEAREIGRVHGRDRAPGPRPRPAHSPPCVLLSGGETTVTVRDKGGRGGRNTEFLLGLAVQLQDTPGIWALAADTDGIDGSETNAGAIVTPDSLERAYALGWSHRAARGNDAWVFFDAAGRPRHHRPHTDQRQ